MKLEYVEIQDRQVILLMDSRSLFCQRLITISMTANEME